MQCAGERRVVLCVDVDVDGVVWGAQGFGVLARRSAVAGEGLGNSTDFRWLRNQEPRYVRKELVSVTME